MVDPGVRAVDVPMSDGLRLRVRVGGRGPGVMLVHGFTGSAEAWGEGILRALARRFRVVVPDLVGHGGSERVADPARFHVERVLGDLAEVQRALIEGPAAWIGYSMGGRLALAGALLRGASVTALVLESASPGIADPVERARRRAADEARARTLEVDGIEAFVESWLAQPLFRTQRALAPSVRHRERDRRRAQDPVSLAACLRGLGTGSQPPLWDRLHEVRVPVLLLTGQLDRKFTDLAQAMVARLPGARHHSVPDTGHAVHLEAPGAWLDTVCGFLESSGTRPASGE